MIDLVQTGILMGTGRSWNSAQNAKIRHENAVDQATQRFFAVLWWYSPSTLYETTGDKREGGLGDICSQDSPSCSLSFLQGDFMSMEALKY